jgi:NAD(P)-dependent dehydrogenase (short-subunit alcohol dehydrogenase family)
MAARSLLGNGHTVVATMRRTGDKNAKVAEELGDLGAHVIEMDVTDDNSVDSAVTSATEAAGSLDVVVNNAGLGVLGVQESFTPDDWKRLFDVNVFGVQRVNRAVLPHMREKLSGLLIHVSSLLGRVTIPFYGPYNASKWALEAMAENYRTELSGFGIDVAIVEPGGYATPFGDNLLRPSGSDGDSAIQAMQARAEGFLQSFGEALAGNPAQNPQNVADAIVGLIEAPAGQRPFRTIVDKMGMGDAIQPYNEHLEKVTDGLYEAFEIHQLVQIET